jgi:signal transduction histidine kinase
MLLGLLDQAPAVVALTVGPEHVFTFANRALRDRLGGRDPLGLPLRQAIPEWADVPYHEAMDCVFGNGEPVRGLQVPLPGHERGEERVDFLHVPVRDAEGAVAGVASFAVPAGSRDAALDARETAIAFREAALAGREAALAAREAALASGQAGEALRAAIEAMKRADAQRDGLLEVVSHELRTPIHNMMGYGGILRQSIADRATPAERRHLEQLMRATDDLAGIVNDLLDLGAIRAGTLALRPRLVDFASLVDEVVGDHAGSAREKRLHLDVSIAPGLPPLVADPGRVVQTLGKLFDNAIRYTPPGGRIAVRVGTRDDALVCEIEDTGVGIPTEVLPHIFEPFRKVDASLTRERGGLGMGLALSKGFAEAHGGTVGVTSVPGRGSTFRVRLPFTGALGAEAP